MGISNFRGYALGRVECSRMGRCRFPKQDDMRLAGVEVKGATDGLSLLPQEEIAGRVVNLFQR